MSKTEGPAPEPLDDLQARIDRAKEESGPKSPKPALGGKDMSGMGMALRIGVEMVSALAVGVGIGLLLDYWLETAPWFLVVFFFLGAGAGIMNVYRAASGIGMAPGYGMAEGGRDGTRGAKKNADNDKGPE